MTAVFVLGTKHRLTPAMKLGEGGEAEVFDLGDGTALKHFKSVDHPDFAHDAALRDQVARRLAEQQTKLPRFPAQLPAQVTTPAALAYPGRRGGAIVGYQMRKVQGEPLHLLSEPRWRREHGVGGDEVRALLLELYDAVAALHQRGVVIGDFNDRNVLWDGARVHLIDADSFQFDGFLCSMFSERFVDPRLCANGAGPLRPTAPHDRDSDWFAFHVMVVRTLLLVGPWGGVYQPADPARRCPAGARAQRRITVFDDDVVWPRAAAPARSLPDELVGALAAAFRGQRRGALPRSLLAELRFSRCARCGDEHARRSCPSCRHPARVAAASPPSSDGALRVVVIDRRQSSWRDLAVPRLPAGPVAGSPALWLQGDALWRAAALGPARIGGVLAGQTHAWAGDELGVGCYRAGGYTVAFVFDPRRGALDDRLRLPALRGELVAATATLAAARAWLWLTVARGGHLITLAAVIDRSAALLACHELGGDNDDEERGWLPGVGGACAVGGALFVPSDAGLLRVELVGGRLAVTRSFADTAPWLCAADRLAMGPGCLEVVRRDDALRLFLA